jgi:hypothetical protein
MPGSARQESHRLEERKSKAPLCVNSRNRMAAALRRDKDSSDGPWLDARTRGLRIERVT